MADIQDDGGRKEIPQTNQRVHVFGGVSSGVYSNYALKMTAIENKDKLDEEVTQTFQNNFYVDHLLNSMENEDMSV